MKPKKYKPSDEQPGESDMMPMPRADPGYLQYLERNSMFTKSAEMAKVVSGSELAWRSPGSAGTPDELLSFADIWLAVHPLTILTSRRSSTFGQLNDPAVWPILREAGVKGLYVAPVQGSGALWAKNKVGVDTGEDVVQYAFSRAAGNDDEYRALMSKVLDNQALIGSDLIPAATGLGPDFFLAARNVREYPGIYCMVDIPQDLWRHLPEVSSEWDTAPLAPDQINALNSEGLLPKAMRDGGAALGRGSGWAATGEVRGVDGNTRRWVYRYYDSPKYAVLNWEDPSKTASRILSGGAVQQVGLRGQSLIGLRLEAFQGLEAAPDKPSKTASLNMEPALTAAASLSREIRRYNGWSWIRDDNLPLTSVADFLRSGSDFIYDSAFSPAAEHALLTGDSSLACFMADEVLRLNIDSRRLVHATPAQDGINYSLPYLRYLENTRVGVEAGNFRRSILASRDNFISHISPSPVQDNYLYATSAGLAAMALDLPKTDTKAYASEVAKGHSLLIFFKAMQPGVLMLAGQDIAGVMPLHYSSMSSSAGSWDVANSSRGSYALTSAAESLAVTSMGMPRAQQIYPAPDKQVHEQGSFLRSIGAFLRARSQSGLAKGTLLSRPRTKNDGAIALLTRMPDRKGFVLSVCNFSRSPITEKIALPNISGMAAAVGNVKAVSLGGSHSISGQTVTVSLGPWEARALFLGSAAGGVQNVASGKVTAVNPLTPPPPVEVVTTPVDRTEPTEGKVAIESPRGEAPPSLASSIAAPSNEPAGSIIPLARISEETAGRAKVKTLRPGQPAELVTTLPDLGNGPPPKQEAAGKTKPGSPSNALFGGASPGLDAAEPAPAPAPQKAAKPAAKKQTQKPAVAKRAPVVRESVQATPPPQETAPAPAAQQTPPQQAAPVEEARTPVLERPVTATPPPSRLPASVQAPAPSAAELAPAAQQPAAPSSVQPPAASATANDQAPVLPPRRARTQYSAPSEQGGPSTLPVRRRAPARPPTMERTTDSAPGGSTFSPAVDTGGGVSTERLSQ